MFEDFTEPTTEELKEKVANQKKIISDLENELIGREREIRDADRRNGEYVEMLDKLKDLIHRYFDEYGKDLYEEWEKEQGVEKQ
jgi:predicted RNase H-like nuclease (RuvC/YqgF family)